MTLLKRFSDEAIEDVILIATINKANKAKKLISDQFYVISKEDLGEFLNKLIDKIKIENK